MSDDECKCRYCRAGLVIDKAIELENENSDHAIFLMLFAAGTVSAADKISLADFLKLAAAAYMEGDKVMRDNPEGSRALH
jgi:hypothetical protein